MDSVLEKSLNFNRKIKLNHPALKYRGWSIDWKSEFKAKAI